MGLGETLRQSIFARHGVGPVSFSKKAAYQLAWYPLVDSENPGTEKCFALPTN